METPRHKDFARRLTQACDASGNVPPLNRGRHVYIKDELEKSGVEVTRETVRKWLAGVTLPRENAMRSLAQLLSVDLAWLSVGSGAAAVDKSARLKVRSNNGLVNVIYGLMQRGGGNPAIPSPDDVNADVTAIDIYAIIKGAKYDITVVEAKDGSYSIPFEAEGNLVLGVLPTGEFAFRVFELDRETVESIGTSSKSGRVVVPVDHDWKEIESFANRL